MGLSMHAWITIATMLCVFLMMAKSRIPAEVSYLAGLTVLLVAGVVSEEEGMSGFGSEPVVVHGAFFVIIAGLIQTGVLYWLTKNVLGDPKNYKSALIRLMVPVGVLSAFLNSVNVVALFIDAVKIWARKLNVSPSKLLLPLSYAATLGGMCTLLGNSSNLVIAGLYLNKTGHSLNMFEPLLPGLAITTVGVILVMLMKRLIPSRETPEQSFETTSDYTVELLVPTDNPAVGNTVEEAGLMNVKGGSLVEIVRFDKEIICPVPKDEWILGGDRLIYAGHINDILELKRSHGLAAADHHVWSINDIDTKRKMRTAYVSFGSDLIGQSMTNSDFESSNDAGSRRNAAVQVLQDNRNSEIYRMGTAARTRCYGGVLDSNIEDRYSRTHSHRHSASVWRQSLHSYGCDVSARIVYQRDVQRRRQQCRILPYNVSSGCGYGM